MDTNAKKILSNIMQGASMAAEDAKSAMQSAGKAVAEKYDYAKASLEQGQLRSEQERIFSEIGKELYHINSGMIIAENGGAAPQQKIDALLIEAEQKQQAIDIITARMNELTRTHHCPKCGHGCEDDDVFCSVCGAKLN
ncbi:MAG: zinc-ribbon domain-containing protein [Oscillospiraceae bacterium]